MSEADSMEKQIVDRMQVPDASGLYVLGCFERRVTLYSQQVRALNLVYALRGELQEKKPSIAVIGAGAGGLTTAAAAAACGCPVSVFERLGRPLGVIGRARTRWLHPHIYDWPAAGAEDPDAGLPLLNWREGLADRVGEALHTQWNELAARFQIELHCDVTDLSIDESAVVDGNGQCQHVLTWNGTGPEPRLLGSSETGSAGPSDRETRMKAFDVIVLAVGFGVETPTGDFPHVKSYWTNDTIDEEDRHSKHPERRVLISGTGDGALIDLLRYSFPNFRHDEAWKQLRTHLEAHGELDRALEAVLCIEARASARGEQAESYITALNLEYRQLADSLKSRAELQVRRNIRPTLTGKNKAPFDLESSALNRFLATFTHAQYIHGGTASVARPRENGPYQVTFTNGQVREFDEALVRHGPVPALKEFFGDIWNRCRDMESRARTTSDPTRLPAYGGFFHDRLGDRVVGVEGGAFETILAPPPSPEESAAIASARADALSTPTLPRTVTAREPDTVAADAARARAPRFPSEIREVADPREWPVEWFDDADFYERIVDAPDTIDRRLLAACMWAVHDVPLRRGILKSLAVALATLVRNEERGGSKLFARIAAALAGARDDRLEPFVRRLSSIAKRGDKSARSRAVFALGMLNTPLAIPRLTDRLRHDERDIRELAATALGNVRNPAAIAALLHAFLHDEGSMVLGEALSALVTIGGQDVVTPLIGILQNTTLSPNLRWPVAEALGRLGDRQAIPVLIHALSDEDAAVREYAARGLGILGDPLLAPQLRPLLEDPSVPVRRSAVEALGRLANPELTSSLVEALDDDHGMVWEAATEALMRVDRGALRKAAFATIEDTTAPRRGEAAEWLCRTVGPKISRFLSLLSGTDVRLGLVRGLARFDGENATQTLLENVDHSSALVREEAARGLGRRGCHQAVTPLITRLLTDSSESVRFAAAMSLGEIGDAAAIDALCDTLNNHGLVKFYAAAALGKIGDERAIPALVAAYRSSLLNAPRAPVSAIVRIGGKVGVDALSTLYALAIEQDRAIIMEEVGRLNHADVVALELKGTDDEDPHVRSLAYDALRELPWGTIKAGLAQALRYTDAAVRRRALEIIPIYAAPPDVEVRERIVELTTHDEDAAVRAAAVEAQRGLKATDAISAYRPPPAPVTS